MILAVVLSFVLTLILGFEDIPETEEPPRAAPAQGTEPVNRPAPVR
ncbi:hypothetical protein SODG_006212 [Sodalis praecaptivus]